MRVLGAVALIVVWLVIICWLVSLFWTTPDRR